MDMEQQAQEDLYARVSTYLPKAFGELAEPLPDSPMPTFRLSLGQLPIGLEVVAVGDDAALVNFFAYVGEGIVVNEEVCRFLLERNAGFWFGALHVSKDDVIRFDYGLPAEAVTKESLSLTARFMSDAAGAVQNELSMRFR